MNAEQFAQEHPEGFERHRMDDLCMQANMSPEAMEEALAVINTGVLVVSDGTHPLVVFIYSDDDGTRWVCMDKAFMRLIRKAGLWS